MATNPSNSDIKALADDLQRLVDNLESTEHGELIYNALKAITQISDTNAERLDWKILAGSLQDMQKAIAMFYPHRFKRKVSIFGSARTPKNDPEYLQAYEFAEQITKQGFMVITGAGGGIMAAGNEGAGNNSFGLNISLPFEQSSNGFVSEASRLVRFRYFFTRKLYFVKESDAIALFPGGFGTQDEFFECLTLTQTGRTTPRPMVLMDKKGGDYWKEWDVFVQNQLMERGLITKEDRSLYQITDDVEEACQFIKSFYSVYHSCRWVSDVFVIRLNVDITDEHLDRLNDNFSDILTHGKIERSKSLPNEVNEAHIIDLPRLTMHFNQHDFGRLHELIAAINDTCNSGAPMVCHPEQR
ncbi:LOG family protein [Pseudanabaena sp. FACHB-1998]|uniref:LOG family protein n=1 Tax=Pseudanabaena sp. FACHB-1998 TaxID=2692858 RepID=UPI0016802DA5|nr:LOG family protein [Pseudanabaena sp. FACHB-1998]MBD2177736.1 LOG family protein [Pseudanabaena sp. FACHB-1998]